MAFHLDNFLEVAGKCKYEQKQKLILSQKRKETDNKFANKFATRSRWTSKLVDTSVGEFIR